MSGYNLYMRVPLSREDCMEQDFEQIKIVRKDGSEIVVSDGFCIDLDPLYFVAEDLIEYKEHTITEQLKPLFVEKKDELIEDLYDQIGNSTSELSDMVIYNFIKENGNE